MVDVDARLAEIAARAEKTTPGPWTIDPAWPNEVGAVDPISTESEWSQRVASVHDEDDAPFIAHAREDVPWLLAVLKEQAGQIERLQRETSQARPSGGEHPEVLSTAAEHLGREGIVTVWDDSGLYVGCMGVERWQRLLEEDREATETVARSGGEQEWQRPPASFWRPVPCGHPQDPVAWPDPEGGGWTCHCGWGLDEADALDAPTPHTLCCVVPCGKCGCYVGIPSPASTTDEPEDSPPSSVSTADAVARSAGESLRQTSYDAPWFVGREPRRGNAVAIKSSCYTVLVVGDYYDGGSDEQEAALAAICEAVNASLAAATGELGSPPDCECDSLRAGLVARDAELAERIRRYDESTAQFYETLGRSNERAAALEAERDELKSLFADNEDFVSRAVDARRELQRENEEQATALMNAEARMFTAEVKVTQLRAERDAWKARRDELYAWQTDAVQELLKRGDERAAAERLAHDRGEALERIAENAEAWHGPNNAGSGHAKALAVIASWAREALAGVVPPEQAP